MSDDGPERGVWLQEDRDAIEAALRSVAERCLRKRSWRSFWWVDIDGCRFKFQISGYAKAHTPIWDEQQAELKAAIAELEAEHGEARNEG